MKAVRVNQDENKSLSWADYPDLEPGTGEVLVEVVATALNRADLYQRAGNYPPPAGASEILGLEMAGMVKGLGASVSGWKVGDRVCALLTGGGYAEQVVVPEALLMPVPDGWSLEDAAAMPEAIFTAYLNLFSEAGLKAGERVLIHGGSSGVGSVAIQLAKAAGAEVATTVGSPEKAAFCRDLRADLVIEYKEQDFAEAIAEHFGAVDVLLDMVGKDYLERNIASLALNGRLIFISTLSGSRGEIDIRELMRKRAMLKGSTLRGRPLDEKVELKVAFMSQFWSDLRSGRIRPVIDKVFDIAEVEEAHEYMRSYRNMGKVVLRVREG